MIPEEAAIIERIFQMCAHGFGVKRIAHTLNAEHAPSPRAQQGRPNGWAPSSVRSVLYRDLYRGEVVWNRTRKRDDWGQKLRTDRAETDCIRRGDPALRIISEELWQAAHARLDAARKTYLRGTSGRVWGRPPSGVDSKHLLPGMARCGACGAGLTVRSRAHGRRRSFRYVCSAYHHRGSSICGNALEIPMKDAEALVLDVMEADVLRSDVLSAALDAALTQIEAQRVGSDGKRGALEDRIAVLEGELQRLAGAVAVGGDFPALLAAVREREQEKAALTRQLATLVATTKAATLDRTVVRAKLEAKLKDWRGLLGRQMAWNRQVVQRLLAGKITFKPTRTEDGRPAYEVIVPLTLERLRVHKVWRPRRDTEKRTLSARFWVIRGWRPDDREPSAEWASRRRHSPAAPTA